MRRMRSSFWLLAPILYTAGMLLVLQPFSGGDAAANVTVRAKTPLQLHDAIELPVAPPAVRNLPRQSALPAEHPDEWVQVVGYTAVARARPWSTAHVLAGYPVGRPFRVIDHYDGFVQVQDLESGQFGWIAETSLEPFTGVKRRQAPVLVASQEPPQPPVAIAAPAQKVNTPAPSSKPATPAKPAAPAAKQPAAEQPAPKVHHVALRKDDSFASIMERAFAAY